MTRRHAVVTGGHRGIGLAISRTLAESGVTVFVGARNPGNPDTVSRVANATDSCGIVLELDVTSTASVSAFAETIQRDYGAVDILVNNAGISAHGESSQLSDDAWQSVIETNLSGPFRTIRAFLPSMKSRGWGRIINIASTAATTAVADAPAYCASKSGLLGLSRAVAIEGAPFGVSCVTVSPTWVETEMLQATAAKMAADKGESVKATLEHIRQANPQQRLVQSDEIAALVSFLCSDAVPGLTMEDIQINAGAFW